MEQLSVGSGLDRSARHSSDLSGTVRSVPHTIFTTYHQKKRRVKPPYTEEATAKNSHPIPGWLSYYATNCRERS